MAVIAKVWIEEDCITCDACADLCPEVFHITDESSYIRAEVREDGAFNRNEGHSPLKGGIGVEFADEIIDAADACPVEVIKFEIVSEGEATIETVETPSVSETVIAPEPIAAVATGDGVLDDLMSGDRRLVVLFGSQTGNSEGIAAKTVKMASAYGLDAELHDMDGFAFDSLTQAKRVLIVTSTWGEGEMPDNAETLWGTANKADAPRLEGTHFTVCALGDTGYDEFCKAGLDWDERLEGLGAQRAHDIVLCDVDYEPPWATWVVEALTRLACVDDSGTLQVELLEAMRDHATGSADEEDAGDLAAAPVAREELEVNLRIFRYDPLEGVHGWDELQAMLPGHATVQDALLHIRRHIDNSLAFRRSSDPGQDPSTGLRINGRILAADLTPVADVVDRSGRITIEPLPGHDVIRDLVVSTLTTERRRAQAQPWLRSEARQGVTSASSTAVGTMDASEALTLHRLSDVHSLTMVDAMSDALDHDPDYIGPGQALRMWSRIQDPRSSDDERMRLLNLLQGHGGIWHETDLSSIRRQGADGALASNHLTDLRSDLLAVHRFSGRSGRHVKWFSRTVKMSGTLNETILAAQTLGPLGTITNLPAVIRMALGFTRTGGPAVRGLQGFLAPGKLPPIINKGVDDLHEVKAIFAELDNRF